MALEFDACPGCGTEDPDDFRVEYRGDDVTAEEAHIFFKTPDPDHIAIRIYCTKCDYSSARSISMR